MTVMMIEQYVHRALGSSPTSAWSSSAAVVVWQGAARGMGEDLLRHYLGESMTAAP